MSCRLFAHTLFSYGLYIQLRKAVFYVSALAVVILVVETSTFSATVAILELVFYLGSHIHFTGSAPWRIFP
ncbi:hypothetical protein B0H11DRAFT_2214814 [Mycena galericulata]|nr:hypothetical protein B0H11DRAFT_2214814 [Mycena galericulata]